MRDPSPLHLLHLYKDYYPVLGGIENHVRLVAEAQAARGHAVTVLVTGPTRQTRQVELNGVQVIYAGRLTTVASTPLSLSFGRLLRGLRPDLTHLHSPYPVGEVAQYLAGRGRPYVLTYHADPTRPIQRAALWAYGPLFQQILRGAACVLVTSPNYAASSPYLRGATVRLAVVPLGVDAERFKPNQVRSERAATLLFVGQLRHYKGLSDLLRALVHLPSGVRLVVAGDGPRRAEWQDLSTTLNLANRVSFLGRVDDAALPGLYRSADVFVLPANTRAEAFGTVLLEAMATGIPCVTTDVGSGTTYVVQDGVTGLVVPPRDPAALAAALSRLLADPALRARMGAAGRARVESTFTQDRMLTQIEAVYRSVLNR